MTDRELAEFHKIIINLLMLYALSTRSDARAASSNARAQITSLRDGLTGGSWLYEFPMYPLVTVFPQREVPVFFETNETMGMGTGFKIMVSIEKYG